MKIALVTDHYAPSGSTYTQETAKPRATILAGHDGGVGSGYGPASGIKLEGSAEVQESKPVGSAKRVLFARGNVSTTLRFTVKPKYATTDAAAAAAVSLAERAGMDGQLWLIPLPEVFIPGQGETATTPALVYPPTVDSSFTESMPHAVVKRVRTKQIGVTVEAEYEIEW